MEYSDKCECCLCRSKRADDRFFEAMGIMLRNVNPSDGIGSGIMFEDYPEEAIKPLTDFRLMPDLKYIDLPVGDDIKYRLAE